MNGAIFQENSLEIPTMMYKPSETSLLLSSSSEDESEDKPLLQTNLKVSKRLKFIRIFTSGKSMYEGTIRIKNNSTRWPVSYRVVGIPSIESVGFQFPMDKPIGYLEPQTTKDILIIKEFSTENPNEFSELSTKRLAIASLPIYYRSQLHPKKIQMLWNILGHDDFPVDSCELHEIPMIYPQNDHFCGDSITQKTVTGNFIAPKDRVPTEEWIPVPKFNEAELKTIFHTLSPTESKDTIGSIHREQLREIKDASFTLKKQLIEISVGLRTVVAAIILGGIALLTPKIYECLTAVDLPPPPPPSPWYVFW